MLVTRFPIYMICTLLVEKALPPITETLSGITTFISPQPVNALFPMLLTLSGILMLERLLQFENAESPMTSTPSGKTTLINSSQEAKAFGPML